MAIVAGLYVLAKALEALDRPIFELGHIVSGHTLKHLAAAGAGYWILRMLLMRRLIDAIQGGTAEDWRRDTTARIRWEKFGASSAVCAASLIFDRGRS